MDELEDFYGDAPMLLPPEGRQLQATLVMPRPRCVACGSTALTITHSKSEDDSKTQRVRCDECGNKFKIVWA